MIIRSVGSDDHRYSRRMSTMLNKKTHSYDTIEDIDSHTHTYPADITDDSIRIRGTKTKLSDRTIPLSSELKTLIESIPKVNERVFPYTYECIRKHFNSVVSCLPFDLTLKDLRHTFGTRCIESGVSLKAVQKWLGHSNYKTTESIYIHVLNEFEQQEMAKLKLKKCEN